MCESFGAKEPWRCETLSQQLTAGFGYQQAVNSRLAKVYRSLSTICHLVGTGSVSDTGIRVARALGSRKDRGLYPRDFHVSNGLVAP